MTDKKPIIFCDFDGTFTEKDVGYRMFKYFSKGRSDAIVKEWKKGLISSRECLHREAEMIRVTPKEIFDFLDNFTLRDGAIDFYRKVKANSIPFILVSDGIDIYIDYILNRFGLGEIRRYCNKGIFKGNKLYLEFSSDDNECKRCGSCKGVRIKEIMENTSDHEVIFIGDGLSDICAVPYAGRIFARGDFLKYCNLNNISAIEYRDFFDILKHVENFGYLAG